MTNALTNGAAGGALGAYAGVDPFAGAGSDMGSGPARTYMEFNGKEGRFYKGKDKVEVPSGTAIALDPVQFFRGYICWKDKQMKHEHNVPITNLHGGVLPPLEQLGLPDFGPYAPPPPGDSRGDGYRAQSGMRGLFNDGEAVEYKTSTTSAIRSIGNLLTNYSMQRRSHPEGSWPVITLGVNKFTRKGTTDTQYAPTFLISSWLSPEQVAALVPQGDGGDEGDYDFPGDAPIQQSAAHVGADAHDDDIPYDTPVQQAAAASRPAASVPPRPGNVPPRPAAPRPRTF